MDVFEKKSTNRFLKPFLEVLRFGNYSYDIIGSYSLASQKYAGDIDVNTIIDGRKDPLYVNDMIRQIIDRINRKEDMYFIEFKIQYKNGTKKKFYPPDLNDIKIPEKNFDKIDFLKFDFIIFFDGVFQDLSMNYLLGAIDKETIGKNSKKEINKDIIELTKKGHYYKIVKRLFTIAKLDKDYPRALNLTRYLNTNTGDEYKTLSNLKAIETLLEHYDDNDTKILVRKSLFNLDIKPYISVIEKEIKKLQKKVDDDAYKFLKTIYLN